MPKGKRKEENESVANSIYFVRFDDEANKVHVRWTKMNGQLPDGTFVCIKPKGAVEMIGDRLVDDLEDEYVQKAIAKQVEQGVRKALKDSKENQVTLDLDRNLFLQSTEPKQRGPKPKTDDAEDVLQVSDAAE